METTKVTARIEKNLAEFVTSNFYHGQQQKLFTNIFKSIKILITEDRFDEIDDYINHGESLILPGRVEKY